jgi:hypothetical protein
MVAKYYPNGGWHMLQQQQHHQIVVMDMVLNGGLIMELHYPPLLLDYTNQKGIYQSINQSLAISHHRRYVCPLTQCSNAP